MNVKLRTYQEETRSEIRSAFANGSQRVVMCLPTGAGKTVVFSDIVSRAARRGSRVLLLTDRLELFKQTMKAIERTGTGVEIIDAKAKRVSTKATVIVGMIETIKRRWSKAQRQTEVIYNWKHSEIDWRYLLEWTPDLIVIDEAHKGSFNKILTDIFPDVRIIGATATPVGKHFYKHYQSIVQTIDVPDLVEEGFLSPVKAYQMKDVQADMSGVKMTGGDYNEKEMFGKFDDAKLYAGVVSEWSRMAFNRKTMVFCVNIEHSQKTHREFVDSGYLDTYIVHSNMSQDERQYNIRSFEKSSSGIMVNCGILTTGYDHPPVSCIVLNRATASLPLFLQMIGRGSRISEGKQDFIVLDFGENHTRHGCWDEPRQWKLDPPKKKKLGAAPTRTCEGCEAMLPAQQRECPHCGLIKEYDEKDIDDLLKQGQLVPVSMVFPELIGKRITEVSIDDLIALEKLKRYKSTFIWRVLRSRGTEAIREYHRTRGHKYGWLQRQLQLIEQGDTEVKDIIIR